MQWKKRRWKKCEDGIAAGGNKKKERVYGQRDEGMEVTWETEGKERSVCEIGKGGTMV